MSVICRIVLDTNVFVAAGFNPRSHAARLLAAVRDGVLFLAWHMETRAETLHVLSRIPPLRQLDVAELFRPDAEYTALVSNDAPLLDHRHALRIPVLTPRVCWEAWGRGADVGDGECEEPRRTHDDD